MELRVTLNRCTASRTKTGDWGLLSFEASLNGFLGGGGGSAGPEDQRTRARAPPEHHRTGGPQDQRTGGPEDQSTT